MPSCFVFEWLLELVNFILVLRLSICWQSEKEHESLREAVEQHCENCKQTMSEKDCILFQMSKEERMKRHPKMIKRWLQLARTCKTQHCKEQTEGLGNNNKIAKCFNKMRRTTILKINGSKGMAAPSTRRLCTLIADHGWIPMPML